MLCTPGFTYSRQLSSFNRAPTLWFIDLTVATCHIRYTFLSLCQLFSGENGQKTKIVEVRHFVWYENGGENAGRQRLLGAQSTERAHLTSLTYVNFVLLVMPTQINTLNRA